VVILIARHYRILLSESAVLRKKDFIIRISAKTINWLQKYLFYYERIFASSPFPFPLSGGAMFSSTTHDQVAVTVLCRLPAVSDF